MLYKKYTQRVAHASSTQYMFKKQEEIIFLKDQIVNNYGKDFLLSYVKMWDSLEKLLDENPVDTYSSQ